jgi:hypothetical protein
LMFADPLFRHAIFIRMWNMKRGGCDFFVASQFLNLWCIF